MPRMPKYLKEEWAFFLDELELSAEDAFSAFAPRMGRSNDREEAATDFIRSLLLGADGWLPIAKQKTIENGQEVMDEDDLPI